MRRILANFEGLQELDSFMRALLHDTSEIAHALHPHCEGVAEGLALRLVEQSFLLLQERCEYVGSAACAQLYTRTLTFAASKFPMRFIELLLVLVQGRVVGLLVAELDEATNKDLPVAHDGLQRGFAVEDVLERAPVGRQGVDVLALRFGERGEQLGYPNRDVLLSEVASVHVHITGSVCCSFLVDSAARRGRRPRPRRCSLSEHRRAASPARS